MSSCLKKPKQMYKQKLIKSRKIDLLFCYEYLITCKISYNNSQGFEKKVIICNNLQITFSKTTCSRQKAPLSQNFGKNLNYVENKLNMPNLCFTSLIYTTYLKDKILKGR